MEQPGAAVPHALRLPDHSEPSHHREAGEPPSRRAQQTFAAALDAAGRPFHHINCWGSRAGGRILTPAQMAGWMDRVIRSLHHHDLEREGSTSLQRSMAFPTGWDPYFTERMSLAEVYHYATLHFDHHRRQLTLGDQAIEE